MARSSASFAGSSASRHVRRRSPAAPHGTAGHGEQLALPGSGLAPVTDRRGARRAPRRVRTCQGPELSSEAAVIEPSRPGSAPVVADTRPEPHEAERAPVEWSGEVPVAREAPVQSLSDLVSSFRSGVTTLRREVRLVDLGAGAVALGAFGLWALVLGLLAG